MPCLVDISVGPEISQRKGRKIDLGEKRKEGAERSGGSRNLNRIYFMREKTIFNKNNKNPHI